MGLPWTITEQQIRQLIAQGETDTVRFLPTAPYLDTVLEVALVLAEKQHGGIILVGVGQSGEVLGTDRKEFLAVRNIHLPAVHAGVAIRADSVMLEGKDIIVVRVRPPQAAGYDPLIRQVQAASDANEVAERLAVVRDQLQQIQSQASTPEQVRALVQEAIAGTRSAVDRADILSARLLLPPPELTDTRLVPAYSLDRLEEYHSDANWAFLAVGAVGGALLGFFVNWGTMESVVVTRFTYVVIGLLAVALGVAVAVLARAEWRTRALKRRILEYPIGEVGKAGTRE